MLKIISTTDGRFLGQDIEEASVPIHLGDYDFVPDNVQDIGDGITCISNSNYVINCK
jgi:hypothetical protein